MEVCTALTITPRTDTSRYPRAKWLLPSEDHDAPRSQISTLYPSIGQVYHAVLAPPASPTGRPERVVMRIQFPNIAESMASDLSYICILLMAGRLLPRCLFLDKTLAVLLPPYFVQQTGGADDDVCALLEAWRGLAPTRALKSHGCGKEVLIGCWWWNIWRVLSSGKTQ